MCLQLDNAMRKLADKIAELHVAETNLDTKMAELAAARDRLAVSRARSEQRFNMLVNFIRTERDRDRSM